MTQQILIQITPGESTRTVRAGAELLGRIRLGVTSLVIDHTRGPVPSVKVIALPNREEWDVEADIELMVRLERERREDELVRQIQKGPIGF